MEQALLARAPGIVFRDPIGERRPLDDPGHAESLEILSFRPELTTVSSFEFALRERVSRLASFRHTSFDRVRSVERVRVESAGGSALALVSERTPGVRLSEILERVERLEARLDINTALSLTRRLVPAVALLHGQDLDLAHGAIGPERILVTPDARLVIVEHVLGSALEQLRYSHERYWQELRIPVPRTIGGPRLDHRTDVTQIGLVVLALVLGRRLLEGEYPSQVGELVASAWAHSPAGGLEPLPPGLRAWLRCALQLDPRGSFRSAIDARAELERMVGDSGASPLALETFLVEYHASREAAPVPAPNGSKLAAVPGPAVAPAAAVPPIEIVDWPPAAAQEAGDREEEDVALTVPSWRRRWRIGVLAFVALAVLSGGAFAARRLRSPAPPALQTGTLVVDSNPAGAQATIDGELRGVTPVTVTLQAGTHTLELTNGGEPRVRQVIVAAGGQTSQYIELPRTEPSTGQLQIRTEPAGATVIVDGVPRGASPLTIDGLTAGPHVVSLEHALGSVKQQVTVDAGAVASLVVPLASAQAGPASGWIALTSPVTVQLYESGRLIGSSESERIMLPAGKHDVEIASQALGFRVARTLQVVPGKVAAIAVDLPKQRIAVNAIPWAEVWIDGERMGETPIGDASVTVGPHEIVFRHPDLGERHQTITVTAAASARVSVDLRKK